MKDLNNAVRFLTVDDFSIGQRLDNYLIKKLKGVPKSHIYKIIRKGEIRVNKGRKKAKYRLNAKEIIRIPPIRITQKNNNNLIKDLDKFIIYEDEGLLVINKKSGLAVHGGSGIDAGIIESLKEQQTKPIELVHRIDRATSGVLMLAKKRSVLKSLHEQFSKHQIEKKYIALVKNSWSKKRHTIDAAIEQKPNNVIISNEGKNAISHFHPIKNFKNKKFSACLTDITIETGRMHQIRIHSKYARHPIAQDDKYGDKDFNKQIKSLGLKRLFLHAKSLTFTNPSNNEIQKVSTPMPDDLANFLKLL